MIIIAVVAVKKIFLNIFRLLWLRHG